MQKLLLLPFALLALIPFVYADDDENRHLLPMIMDLIRVDTETGERINVLDTKVISVNNTLDAKTNLLDVRVSSIENQTAVWEKSANILNGRITMVERQQAQYSDTADWERRIAGLEQKVYGVNPWCGTGTHYEVYYNSCVLDSNRP